MKRLDRYVIRELFVPFMIGTLAVVMMFDINLIMAITKEADLSHVPKQAIAQLIMYKTPFFLNMTLPVGVSLAASLAMSRLSRESELTAMRSAGARILRVIRPIVLFGVVVAIGAFLNVEKLMPVTERKSNELQRQIGTLVMIPDLAQNVYVKLDKFQVHIGSANRAGQDRMSLTDILIYSNTIQGQDQLIHAAAGSYDHGAWNLNNADVWIFEKGELTRFRENQNWNINDKIAIDDLMMPPMPEEQTLTQLKKEIIEARKQHRPSKILEISYWVRFSTPAACIVFALFAPAVAIKFGKSGFAGVLLSIVLVGIYYNAFVLTTEILGKNGSLPAIPAAWLPDIVFAVLGLFFIRRLE